MIGAIDLFKTMENLCIEQSKWHKLQEKGELFTIQMLYKIFIHMDNTFHEFQHHLRLLFVRGLKSTVMLYCNG